MSTVLRKSYSLVPGHIFLLLSVERVTMVTVDDINYNEKQALTSFHDHTFVLRPITMF